MFYTKLFNWRRLAEVIDNFNMNESPERRLLVNLLPVNFQEGPHMMLNEEEFYDAVETALDKHDEEEEENDDVVKIAKFTFSTRRNAQINMKPVDSLQNKLNQSPQLEKRTW